MKLNGSLPMGAQRGSCLHVCVCVFGLLGEGVLMTRERKEHHLPNKRKRPAVVKVYCPVLMTRFLSLNQEDGMCVCVCKCMLVCDCLCTLMLYVFSICT